MAQISTYKIGGAATTPWRSSENIEIEAIFGIENTASISLDNVTFPNSELNNNSDLIRTNWLSKPLEGVPVSFNISDGSISFDFNFFADWNNLVFKAENETSIGLIKENGVIGFEASLKSITFALLESEGLLGLNFYTNVPYVIENRKTLMEKLFLLSETSSTAYQAANEVVKIIQIASNIISIGIIIAIVSLAIAITKLIKMIIRLVKLFKDIKETFFPSVRYHSGIQPKIFLTQTVSYLGYSGIDFGTLTDTLNGLVICPSKFDLVGIKNNVNQTTGALNPSDYGYNASEMLQYLKDSFTCRVAIINDIVHIRPENDPFWVLNPGSNSPTSLVEDSITTAQGTTRPNYGEFYSSTILRYQTDDSDLWTLEDLADTQNPASSQKIIAGKIVKQIGTTNNKRLIPQKGKVIDIPYTLCTRKDTFDDLLDIFDGMLFDFNKLKEEIKERYEELSDTLGEDLPALAAFTETFGGRTGVMKIENHFFSTAKVVFLRDTQTGFGTKPLIPANFANFVGAKHLIDNYYNYFSFVPGVRSSVAPLVTNAKYIYEGVKIKLNLQQFNQILDNPYFNVPGLLGNSVGKYTSIKWNVEKDFAIVDYWVPNPWLINAQEISI